METTFYQDAGATVTNTRFITNGQTHAMSGITSVTETSEPPLWGVPLILGIFGLGAWQVVSWMLGALLIVGAILWAFNQRGTYSVTIRTAAGELKALSDSDQARVSKIVAALNDAIVFRG